MAKTDRDPNYMKETFGTESLITDYGPTPSLPTSPKTLDSILTELEEILSIPYRDLAKRDNSNSVLDDPDGFIEDVIDFGYNSGVRHLAEKLYPTLKALQNQQ
jgi:hypothetical protein